MTRNGFTLIELVAALVITSVVALLVYGTARTGLDTRDQLERHQSSARAHARVRALLGDALRHLPEEGGAAMNDMLFTLEDRTNNRGLPSDGLHFVTQSRRSGSSGWSITLAPTAHGVRLTAAPMRGDAPAIETLLEDTRGLNVRVLRRADDSAWTDFWELPGRVPAAVAIDFLTESGAAAAPRIVIRSTLDTGS